MMQRATGEWTDKSILGEYQVLSTQNEMYLFADRKPQKEMIWKVYD